MSTQLEQGRRPRPGPWSPVNFPIAGFYWFVGLLWVGLFAVDLAITASVAIWGEIESSVWEQAGEIVRFFALAMTGWLVYTYLPIYVAHGVTRREFMQKLMVFTALFSTLMGALAAVGFLLERLVYEVADWPQDLTEDHVFDSPTELPTIFLAHTLAFLVWSAVGAIVGAAIYRHDDGWGLLALPVGIVLLIPGSFAIGSTDLPLIGDLLENRAEGLLLAIALCLLGAAAGLGFAWALIREMPLRSRST